MQIAALPTSVYRAANSRPAPELRPQAANRLTLIEQWEAMRGEGITAAKAADILRVPRANLYRWMGPLNRALREWEAYYNAERGRQSLGWLSPMEYLAEQRVGTAS